MWCLLTRFSLKSSIFWVGLYFAFPLFSFSLFCSLSGMKLKFLSSLCCSTTVIRHIWNDTPHTCILFPWYLYWYLMSVVKQWLQLHSILSCMYHTVVWVPSYRVFNLSGILLVKSVKVVVIMWFFLLFLLFILMALKTFTCKGTFLYKFGFRMVYF